jgi:hypothetical protein
MLIDGISRQQLQDLALSALLGGTLAGPRVFESGDWPTRPELFPMLLVSAPRERKVAIMPGTLQFNTTITLAVVGRLVGPLPGPVGAALELLSEQILNALLLNIPLTQQVQEFNTIDVATSVTSDGKQHVGEIGLTFEMLVYQDYGPIGDPLTDITANIAIGEGSGSPAPTVTVEMLPTTIIQTS